MLDTGWWLIAVGCLAVLESFFFPQAPPGCRGKTHMGRNRVFLNWVPSRCSFEGAGSCLPGASRGLLFFHYVESSMLCVALRLDVCLCSMYAVCSGCWCKIRDSSPSEVYLIYSKKKTRAVQGRVCVFNEM